MTALPQFQILVRYLQNWYFIDTYKRSVFQRFLPSRKEWSLIGHCAKMGIILETFLPDLSFPAGVMQGPQSFFLSLPNHEVSWSLIINSSNFPPMHELSPELMGLTEEDNPIFSHWFITSNKAPLRRQSWRSVSCSGVSAKVETDTSGGSLQCWKSHLLPSLLHIGGSVSLPWAISTIGNVYGIQWWGFQPHKHLLPRPTLKFTLGWCQKAM